MAWSRAANASLMFLMVLFCCACRASDRRDQLLAHAVDALFRHSSSLRHAANPASCSRRSQGRRPSAPRFAPLGLRSASALYFEVTRASQGFPPPRIFVSNASSSVAVFSLKADAAGRRPARRRVDGRGAAPRGRARGELRRGL